MWYNISMNERLKELMKRIEDWPLGVQEEAVAALEAIAGYVNRYEPEQDYR